MLRVLVSETGSPLQITVLEGARGGLTEAAVEAVRRWRFEPATKRGMPVRTWTTERIPFEAIPFPRFGTAAPSGIAPAATPTRTPLATPVTRAAERPIAASTPVPTRSASPGLSWLPAPAPPEPPSPLSSGDPPDSVYRTRRAVRLAISPDQARIFVDGRYVGVADDWDDRGGGAPFEFTRRGPHRVRAELPGYRLLEIEVDVSPAAEEDLVEVVEEMTSRSRVSYTRLPAVAAQTRGPVELRVDPPDASVSVNGRDLGPVGALSQANPVRLPGPAVHDLIFSSPGRRSKQVRVLVSGGAPREMTVLDVKLLR